MRFFNAGRDELYKRLARHNTALSPGTLMVTETELDRWIFWYKPPFADELELCIAYSSFAVLG